MRRMTVVAAMLTAGLTVLAGMPASVGDQAGGRSGAPHWRPVPTGSDQQFRGLDAVDRHVAWVGGSDGAVLRTTDAGRTWTDVSPRNTVGLLFRDVEAKDAMRASVLAIGEGVASRIYTTTDGGATWKLAFVNHDPRAFYDCMAFFPGGKRGLAVSDPVGGKFRIIATHDFGHSWRVRSSRGMPKAVDGEFAFAASGTCLVTAGWHDVWLASGGAASRIFHSADDGRTWAVADATIPAADAGGVFSLSFRTTDQGVAVGGDFTAPDNGDNASAFTLDGGRTWRPGGDLGGYRSGVDWVGLVGRTAIAVGPTGSDVSHDAGRTWSAFDTTAYDAVSCTRFGSCWASGPEGAVAKLVW